MSQYAPDERVMVSPRYMAGAGDRIADVIGPLIHLFGWNHEHDAHSGHISIDSPDRGLSVQFASFAYHRPTALTTTRPAALRPSGTPTPARSR